MIATSSSAKATQLYAAITSCAFMVALLSAQYLLHYTKPLSVQKEGLDLCKAMAEVKLVQTTLLEIRRDADRRFNEIFASVSEKGKIADIQISVPRICSTQSHRSNIQNADPETFYRATVFLPLIDSITMGLNDRFNSMQQDVSLASKLVPSILITCEKCKAEDISKLASAFPDMPSVRSLPSEYERWYVKWCSDRDSASKISCFVDAVRAADVDLFPNIRMLFLVSAIRPSSTATNERSFSALKRLKTYLRSNMHGDRLTGLALLHIHQDIPIVVETIIDNFALLGPHRLAFL